MNFRTRIDFTNRQAKQNEKTDISLSGASTFGLPYSALTAGPDLSMTAITFTDALVESTYSGNTGTTIYNWEYPIMSVNEGQLSALTPTNSGTTQDTTPTWTGYDMFTTVDGYTGWTSYSAVTYDVDVSTMIDNGGYSGLVYSFLTVYSASSLDYTGSTIWVDVSGITRTDEIIISNGAVDGYVLKSDANGLGSWQVDASGSTFTGNTSATCISDIFVSNIHSCSPLYINPLVEGDIYFGALSANTFDLTNNRLGIGIVATGSRTTEPQEALEIGEGEWIGINTKTSSGVGSTSGIRFKEGARDGLTGYGVNMYYDSNLSTDRFIVEGMFASVRQGGLTVQRNGLVTIGMDTTASTTTSTLQIGEVGNVATLKYVDGNQSNGYVMTSDSNGGGSWQAAGGSSLWTAGTGTNAIVMAQSDGNASGELAVAEGDLTIASGNSSHAEGRDTIAGGDHSHAEGKETTASGFGSHAEGYQTLASSNYAHAEGLQTTASAFYSHAQGNNTLASGSNSHAEGQNTTASNGSAHAEGSSTTASGIASHAEGQGTTATGITAHAEGKDTVASGDYTHAEGQNSTASGYASHAEGYGTLASGTGSHAEGFNSIASFTYSHAEGESTISTAVGSHSEGSVTSATTAAAHAEGSGTLASGSASHAEGTGTVASGNYSHAGGSNSTASGAYSFIHSSESLVTGVRSVVLGGQNITGGTDDMVYVPDLVIDGLVSTDPIATDANGMIVAGASDARLKTNIQVLESALDKIKNLRGVSYEWTEDSNMGAGVKKYGLIAQEVQEVIPDMVRERSKGDGMLSLSYTEVVPWLIEAIKELSSGSTIISNEQVILETQTIASEDNNIELNYGGNHETSVGGGITVLDGVKEGVNAEIKTDENGNWVMNPPLTTKEYTPTSTNDVFGKVGDTVWDVGHIYIKTNAGWKRSSLENF